MSLILPLPSEVRRTTRPNVTALVSVLVSADPDLWALELPGESLSEMRARRDAAADILDSMLTEITAESAAWEVAA